MKLILKYVIKGLLGLLLLATVAYGILWLNSPVSLKPGNIKPITIKEAPTFGLWMYTGDKTIACWLGEKYQGKELQEPINIIIIDELSRSEKEAENHLKVACEQAGYANRGGHSDGYLGLINGVYYRQLPKEPRHAYSNAPFIVPNNHGRIFGPVLFHDKYYFTAAFSREDIAPLQKVKHGFVSFNEARDDFAVRMDRSTPYRIGGKLKLDNRFPPDNSLITGDRIAIVLLRRGEE